MATAKLVIHPFAVFDSNGQLKYLSGYRWPTDDKFDTELSEFTIGLPRLELELEVPEDPRPACIQLLQHERGQLTAKHQAMLTKFQFTENQLLGLAAPEILDPLPQAPARSAPGTNDDIPS